MARRIFGNWWVVSLIVAALMIVLFAVLAPLVLAFFAHWSVRLGVVLLIIIVWSALAAWHLLAAKKASDRLQKKLGIAPERTLKEGDVLAERMRDAVAALRQGGRGASLYRLPWYIMIGPPGAGKTTALLNSGLHLPVGDMRGVGGTRNVEFLIADEAVILDTAGRYTTQDSDAAEDHLAWLQLLDLLQANRPLQPINGVIIAIGLDEIAGAGAHALERHAGLIEARLNELQEGLKVEVPVYVLFTKADLIAGFAEFFDDLDVEGRRAVLGATLPWKGAVAVDAEVLTAHFDELLQAIDARTAKRLEDDHDARRRGLIVGFPAQVAALRSRLLFLLGRIFAHKSRKAPFAFRGFYFTSGIQMGTPIDRVLGRVASLYDAAATPVQGRGRAFFLNRLLEEVVFGEAGLVCRSKSILAQQKRTLIGGGAAIAAVCLVFLTVWTVSYFNNRAWIAAALDGANGVRTELDTERVNLFEVRDTDPDAAQLLPALQALRDIPGGYGERHGGGHSIWATFGLYQDSVGRLAELTYLDIAQRALLPRLMLRLEQRLRTDQSDRLASYDTLKVYLMAGGQAPELDGDFIQKWAAADWSSNVYPGSDAQPVRDELVRHLGAVLHDPQFGQLWDGGVAPLDADLVGSARSVVEGMPMADRAYAILKQKAMAANGDPWRADGVLSPGVAKAFANGQAVMSISVPYLFTKEGYWRAYQTNLATVERDLQKDAWVLGPDKSKLSTLASFQNLRRGVAVDYAREYVDIWRKVLGGLAPGAYFNDMTALSAAVSQPSPIKLMMQEVDRNTFFDKSRAASAAQRLVPQAASGLIPTQGGGSNDAAGTITAAFASLHLYVNGKGEPSLDDFLAKLAAASQALSRARNQGADQTAVPAAVADLKRAAEMAPRDPPELGNFLVAASAQGDTAQTAQIQTAASTTYGQMLLPACRAVTDNRYPFFFGAAPEATVADLMPVFGPGSQFDTFVTTQLRSHIDMAGPVWHWLPSDPVAAGFDPQTPAQLQKIDALRTLLTTGVQAKIEAVSFGGTITAAEFFGGGTPIRFERGQSGSRSFLWTIAAQPEARVALFAGTQAAKQFDSAGTWAVFHLFDSARTQAATPDQFTATFGEGAAFVTFRVSVVGARGNPFSRQGLWSFRCPPRL
jgi:type VI secretion system protein ImpL